ncbi:MAG: hypothetical protein AAF787_05600 [Chloroflexota bacterium]
MTITVSWHDDEHTITRLDFKGNVTINELFDAWREELLLMRSVDHPVYSLNVFENYHMMLGHISVNKLVSFIRDNRSDNLQMTIQITEGTSLRRMLATLAALMPHDVRIVPTIADAEAIITAHRNTIQRKAS